MTLISSHFLHEDFLQNFIRQKQIKLQLGLYHPAGSGPH